MLKFFLYTHEMPEKGFTGRNSFGNTLSFSSLPETTERKKT